MTLSVLLLTLAYVVSAALLLSMNLATRYAAWQKGVAIIVVSGLYAGTWFGFQGMTGWATTQPMPESFRVLWIAIDERRSSDDVPSAIYYWVRSLDEAGLPQGQPRAFRRPWSERAAEEAEQAIAALEAGEELNGTLSRNLMQAAAEDATLSDYAGERSITGESEGEISIRFTTAPARQLPPKLPPG
jgi:hypothetical protein